MAQFGAATIIDDKIRLIILDCFETLVEMVDGIYRPRRGIVAFLKHFKQRPGMKFAIATDTDVELVMHALKEAKLEKYFSHIYHAGNAVEPLPDGRIRKRLDIPLRDFKLEASQAMFIGDSPMDAESANHHHLHFIRVPRSEDRNFTFACLIGGPSHYNSAEFSVTFLEQYLNTPKNKKL